jgi:hypothetical protein
VVVKRIGNKLEIIAHFIERDTFLASEIIAEAINDKVNPVRVDSIGYGAAVATSLKSKGFNFIEILFGERSEVGRWEPYLCEFEKSSLFQSQDRH